MTDETSREGQVFSLPSTLIDWYTPDDIQSRYATNIVVQSGPNEFIISFFEIRPPIVLGSPEQVKATLEQIKSIRAICVSRIIISREEFPRMIKVLQDQLERSQPIPEKS